MSVQITGLSRGFRWLLRLLPDDFAREFGEEMHSVFCQRLHEAKQKNLAGLLAVLLLEGSGLLRLIFSEQGRVLRDGLLRAAGIERSMQMNTKPSDTPWVYRANQNPWLAALPPFIFSLGGALGLLAGLTGSLYLVVGAWVLTVLVIGAGGLAALLKRLPDWGWTWSGAALMLGAAGLKLMAEELAETGKFILSPFGDLALMGVILLAGFVLLLAAAWRGWQPAGLVSLGFTAIFGLSTLTLVSSAPFNRTDLALLVLPAGILYALLIRLYILGRDGARVGLLAGAWFLNAGMFYLAHRVWQPWLSARGSITPLIPLLVFSTGFVLSGPLVGLLRKSFLKMFAKI